jgi:UDPglucose--hexose-1-phosphate uridylyltransferase
MADLDDHAIKDVLVVYRGRMLELEKTVYLKSVLVFKNYGRAAGAGLNHSCSQLIATPVNFKRVKEELEGARFYYETHERCVFCDIVKQELETSARIVLDEQGFAAFVPFAPRFPFEVWVVPKKHGADFYKSDDAALDGLAGLLKKLLSKIKAALGDPAYNYVIHTAPFRRPQAGYWSTIEDDFHWHMEIIPHLDQPAGFEWGTGFYICPAMPEEAAKILRDA